jgi:hypothetical protein
MSDGFSQGIKDAKDYERSRGTDYGWQEGPQIKVEAKDLHNHYTLRELEKAVVEAKLKYATQRLKDIQQEIEALSKNKLALTDMSHP